VALVAWAVDGDPLEAEHGAPLRLVVPHLYFWKSVKWLRRIELWRDPDVLGFWERNGYHEHGDPFREQRYWGDDE
jgi:DMSO/TMAO reductase YedYZ molybdopterin-dependent catalytic subunit